MHSGETAEGVAAAEQARKRWLTLILTAGIFAALLGSSVATPLYVVYQQRWGVSSLVTSLAFVAYAMGVLPTLIVTGRILERLADRTAMLMFALAAIGGGAALIALAPGAGVLILGRFVCGAGTGAMLNAGSLALIDIGDDLDRARAAGLSTIALTAGAGAGPLLGAGFVALDFMPLTLPYLIVTALAASCAIGLLKFGPLPSCPGAFRESAARSSSAGGNIWAVVFPLACLGIVVSWALGATLLALGGLVLADLTGSPHVVAAAGAVAMFQICAGVTQTVCRAVGATWGAMTAGSALLALSLAAAAYCVGDRALEPLLGVIVLSGIGYGACFTGSAAIVADMAPEFRRSSFISGFYAIGYAANWTPVLLAGLAGDLPLSSVLIGYCLASACLAAVIACAAPILARAPAAR